MKFMPWHNTLSLAKGITSLNRMYDSLFANNTLKQFLDNHCLHLLKPLEGHTGIPTDFSKPSVIVELPNTVKLNSNFTPSQFKGLPGTVGIYVFYFRGHDSVVQCGSTLRFINRMMNHYRDASKGIFIFKEHIIQDYYWTPIAYTSDYISLFNHNNVMDKKQERILHAFIEQEVRSLEQAFTTYASPTNYKGISIHTSHNNWEVGDYFTKSGAKRIRWTCQNGAVHTRYSMSARVQELGFTIRYLKKVARSYDSSLTTDKYGLVKINIENIHVTDSDQDVRYGTPLNTLVDTTSLNDNLYYLYDTSINKLPYGPYSTVTEVNKAMGLDTNYSGTYLWCNYMHTIEAASLGVPVYVVKGLSSTKIPIVVKNLKTDEVKEYSSINSALKVIYPNNRGGYILLKAMVTNTPFSTPDGNSYLLTFKDPGHLALSIKKYNLHKRTKLPIKPLFKLLKAK